VKKDEMRATRFSVVVLMPLGVEKGIVTSPHACTVVNNQFNQSQPQDLNELKKAWRLKFQD
jgi:hypothetical protein